MHRERAFFVNISQGGALVSTRSEAAVPHRVYLWPSRGWHDPRMRGAVEKAQPYRPEVSREGALRRGDQGERSASIWMRT